jgi:hypothetical protein
MAAEPGFEPGLRDPKSPVLPLHNSASYINYNPLTWIFLGGAEGRARTDMEVILQQFLRLPRLPIPPLRLITWCRGPESNWGHADFQSAALPTELPRHKIIVAFSHTGVKQSYPSSRLILSCRHIAFDKGVNPV